MNATNVLSYFFQIPDLQIENELHMLCNQDVLTKNMSNDEIFLGCKNWFCSCATYCLSTMLL